MLPTVFVAIYPLTGQFADKPTRGQLTRKLFNSLTALFFTKSWNYYICTQNLTLTINPILTIESVKIV